MDPALVQDWSFMESKRFSGFFGWAFQLFVLAFGYKAYLVAARVHKDGGKTEYTMAMGGAGGQHLTLREVFIFSWY